MVKKQKKLQKILISEKVYMEMQNEFYKWQKQDCDCYARAKCFLLGKDSKGVIKTLITLESSKGCEIMPHIETKDMSDGMMKIIKKRKTPCGLFRVGEDDFYNGGSGSGLYDLCKAYKNMYIICMNENDFVIQTMDQKGYEMFDDEGDDYNYIEEYGQNEYIIELPWKVVKEKKKNNSRKKAKAKQRG